MMKVKHSVCIDGIRITVDGFSFRWKIDPVIPPLSVFETNPCFLFTEKFTLCYFA